MSKQILALLISQFASAFADNALLFALLAVIKAGGVYHLDTATPALQMSFVLMFVLLAPLVGRSADVLSKGKILLIGNMVKAFGAIAVLLGLNVFAGYIIIGIGAAIYSPAKYGILSEITDHKNLVKANGLLEGTTILAILGGAIAGGYVADLNSQYAILSVITLYIIASIVSIGLLKVPAMKPELKIFTWDTVKAFGSSVITLCKNQKSSVSLFGTALFWGVGGVLRVALITWVAIVLLSDKLMDASLLNGCVAIGVVIGALLSSSLINFKKMHRVFIPGFLIGAAILIMPYIQTFNQMATLLVFLGACGGLYVVPLNALLQSEGSHSTGGGQAIAIQNFIENIVSVSFIGVYLLAVKNHVHIHTILYVLAAIVLIFMLILLYPNWKKLNEK